ncbi:MAG: hypothetical protein RIT45_3631 [Pseudomonadota bacterium]|jgi:hypothetical protein
MAMSVTEPLFLSNWKAPHFHERLGFELEPKQLAAGVRKNGPGGDAGALVADGLVAAWDVVDL